MEVCDDNAAGDECCDAVVTSVCVVCEVRGWELMGRWWWWGGECVESECVIENVSEGVRRVCGGVR